MSKLMGLIGIAALAGVGYYVAKKVIDKRSAEEEERAQHIYDDDSEVFAEETHTSPKEKFQKASMFAVGAIKTTTDKVKEGIDDIINNSDDMVTKGEETIAKTKDFAAEKKDKAVEFAKNTGENIKEGIGNIVGKVTQKAEEAADEGAALAQAIEQDVDEAVDQAVDMAEAVRDPDGIIERVNNEHQYNADAFAKEERAAKKEAGQDIGISSGDDELTEAAGTSTFSADNLDTNEVQTFDFSNPEAL